MPSRDRWSATCRSIPKPESWTLPPAEIQYVDVDNEATRILDRSTGLFTKDPRLESDTRKVADRILVESAVDPGLLEEAEHNARRVLMDFLLGLGDRDVIVEFAR